MKHPHHHHPGSHLDDPARAQWQKPEAVVAALELREGHVVADVGAGTGYFVGLLSRAVGPGGKVLAVDVNPQLAHQPGNVEVRRVSASDPALASVDRVLIVDVWHHLSDRVAYARKLHAALRPHGRLVVVDYERDAPEGPPPELRSGSDTVMAELREAGFSSARCASEPLPRQFIVIAER